MSVVQRSLDYLIPLGPRLDSTIPKDFPTVLV